MNLTKEEIKQGKKLVILHGDYSRTTQMKGCIPTPNIGIKKLLMTRFEIVDVNEIVAAVVELPESGLTSTALNASPLTDTLAGTTNGNCSL